MSKAPPSDRNGPQARRVGCASRRNQKALAVGPVSARTRDLAHCRRGVGAAGSQGFPLEVVGGTARLRKREEHDPRPRGRDRIRLSWNCTKWHPEFPMLTEPDLHSIADIQSPRGDHPRRGFGRLPVLLVAILASAIAFPAEARTGAGNGQQIARQWCAKCHIVAADQKTAVEGVPSFKSIGERLTDDQIRAALFAPHPPMPNFEIAFGRGGRADRLYSPGGP